MSRDLGEFDTAWLGMLFHAITDAADRADIGVAVTLQQRDLRNVWVNDAAARMVGMTREEMLEKPVWSLIAPADRARMRAARRDRSAGMPRPDVVEVGMLHESGRVVPVEYTVSEVLIGQERASVSFFRDISERRQAQLDRDRMRTRLMQADRLAAVGQLAAGVAHEINNPLGYVTLNLELLGRDLAQLARGGADVAQCLERVEVIQQGVQRMATIVNDLRAFSRKEHEARSIVDLDRVLRFAMRMATGKIGEQVRVTSEMAPVPFIYGNEARLEQVFINLLMNAAQAMPDRSPTENEIRVSMRHVESCVHVEVSDNGVGIEPEVLDRVFDPFFTTKPAGTGLGLAISRGIVTAMGGRIEVDSTVGVGSRFSVQLPLEGLRVRGLQEDAT